MLLENIEKNISLLKKLDNISSCEIRDRIFYSQKQELCVMTKYILLKIVKHIQ